MAAGNSPLRVIIADDQALVRGGLALLIRMIDNDIEIIEANNLHEIVSALSSQDPIDLVLADLLMPGMNGFEGIKRICEAAPDVPVVVVSVKESVDDIRQALDSGAMGYIPKTSTPDVMVSAVKLVLSGGMYLPPHLLGRSATHETQSQGEAGGSSRAKPTAGLTPRQKEVLSLMAKGKSNREIASLLGLAPGTVKVHALRIFKALNVQNRTEAVVKSAELRKEPDFS